MNDSHDDQSPFWGQDETPTGQIRRIGRDVTGQISRIVHDHNEKHHFDRTREHRAVRPFDETPVHVNPYDYDLDDGYAGLGHADAAGDAAFDRAAGAAAVDIWTTPEHDDRPRRRAGRTGVDPRLLRAGAIAAAAVVLAPILIAVAAGGADGDQGDLASLLEQPAAGAPEIDPADSTIPITAAAAIPITAAAVDNPSDDDLADNATSLDGVTEKGAGTTEASESASVSAAAAEEAAAPPCAGEYTVVQGDYWYRLSDGSGVEVDAWLSANDATLETPLYAGDELCVPAGATAPAPPTTTAAPETTAAATTEAPTTTEAPATTEAPTTTEVPTTTEAPSPPPPPPTTAAPGIPSDVEGIIRYVWPDELEERALAIAYRESRHVPTAYNGWCCYGLFQIYFNVNRSFLAGQGVTSADQLLDAYTNARVAYAMYQASGWDPWATTDPGD